MANAGKRRDPQKLPRGPGAQLFGGDWTEEKLAILKKYLVAYTTALSRQPFLKLYVDAFAGTGYREVRQAESSLFADLADDAPQKLLEGSAAIALRTNPPFDRYLFIEKRPDRAAELRALCLNEQKKFEVFTDEANKRMKELCQHSGAWSKTRAVLFLDPFGMQVEWSTMQAVAHTGAIDTWILFPVGIAVNRLLTKSLSGVPPEWCKRLDAYFGTPNWREEFYGSPEPQPLKLFEAEGAAEAAVKTATLDRIGRYFHKRLAEIFPAVAPNPRLLRNASGAVLFQLHFASSNAGRGGEIAVKIAKHILEHI